MPNIYLHDPELGIHYQEDTEMKLWIIKEKPNAIVFYAGTEEEMEKYTEKNKSQIDVIYAFSELLSDFMNLVGDNKVLPVLPLDKFVQAGEQVL